MPHLSSFTLAISKAAGERERERNLGKTRATMCGNKFCTEEGVNKGAWSPEEDRILTNYINTHGEGKWKAVAKNSGLSRCHKSCRRRWLNYLKPGILRGNISKDEEDLIIKLHQLLGNRWALIAGRLPGRTDHEIKNYWNNTLVKKLKEFNSSSPTLETLHDNELEENDLTPTEDHGSTENRMVNNLTNGASFPPFLASTSPSLIHNNKNQDFVEDRGVDNTAAGFNNLGFIDYDSWFYNHEINVEDYITLSSSPLNDEFLHSRDECYEKQPLDVAMKELASFLEVDD